MCESSDRVVVTNSHLDFALAQCTQAIGILSGGESILQDSKFLSSFPPDCQCLTLPKIGLTDDFQELTSITVIWACGEGGNLNSMLKRNTKTSICMFSTMDETRHRSEQQSFDSWWIKPVDLRWMRFYKQTQSYISLHGSLWCTRSSIEVRLFPERSSSILMGTETQIAALKCQDFA